MKYFSYDLPENRIAQRPAGASAERTAARLLSARGKGSELSIEDRFVYELPRLLHTGDVLVLNNSKVIPCRFFFEHAGREMEVLLLGETSSADGADCWEALARPMRRLKTGDEVRLSPALSARVIGRDDGGGRMVLRLSTSAPGDTVRGAIFREGSMPIPGYIRGGHATEEDRELYQTVFAKEAGSVAAPTAGLHFTPALLDEVRSAGVDVVELTLHVGPASFQPVRDPETHRMPLEWYQISSETIARIEKAKRVVAVGTTCTRTLETAARSGACAPGELRSTELFIKPGFEFQLVDVLMTNFHQPETSHLLLVAAFIGESETERIYEHALQGEYRFLSYGDSMLLDPGAV